MRQIIFLIFILAIPVVSSAQSTKASWENLTGLHSGQKIQIIGTDLKKHSGTFMSFSDTTLSFHDASGDQSLQKLNITGVKLMENHHRLRNTIIGAGIGTGAGAGIGAASFKPCPVPSFCLGAGRGAQAAIFAVVGFVGGAAIGALWPSHNTIYNANSR